ncbi:helix-turn-helix transcriptional regulator [Ureibacillus composti]|nr:helix-turn-helix transcriptional regulator [Ureibacillus composti]
MLKTKKKKLNTMLKAKRAELSIDSREFAYLLDLSHQEYHSIENGQNFIPFEIFFNASELLQLSIPDLFEYNIDFLKNSKYGTILKHQVMRYRAINELTLEQLSEISGIHLNELSDIENGQAYISRNNISQLLRTTNIRYALFSQINGGFTNEKIGEVFANRRKNLAMSITELSRRANCTTATIYNIENGLTVKLTKKIQDVSRIIGLDFNEVKYYFDLIRHTGFSEYIDLIYAEPNFYPYIEDFNLDTYMNWFKKVDPKAMDFYISGTDSIHSIDDKNKLNNESNTHIDSTLKVLIMEFENILKDYRDVGLDPFNHGVKCGIETAIKITKEKQIK